MATILVRSSTRTSGTTGNFSVTIEANKYRYVRFLRCSMPTMASAPLYIKTSAISGIDNGIVDPSIAAPSTGTGAVTVVFNDTTDPVVFTDVQAKRYVITNSAVNSGTLGISVTDMTGAVVDPGTDWFLLLEFS